MNFIKSLREYYATIFACSAVILAAYVGYQSGKMENPPWKVLRSEKSVSVSSPECEITVRFKDKNSLERYGPCNAQLFLNGTLKELSWEIQNPPEMATIMRLEQNDYLIKKEKLIIEYGKMIGNTNSIPALLFNNPPEKLEKKLDEFQDFKDRT